MKVISTTFSVSCLLILAGCSSSSGGGGGSTPIYFTEKPSEQTETSISSSSELPISNQDVNTIGASTFLKNTMFEGKSGDRFIGALFKINEHGEVEGQNLKSYVGEDLNVLMVNNVEIPLLPIAADDEQSGFKQIQPSDYVVSKLGSVNGYTSKATTDYRDVRYYQFVRFGMININKDSTLFVQGLQTPTEGTISDIENGYATLYSMPKSGKFVYKKGEALYGKDGSYQQLIANVSADFTNKQLDVSLRDSETQAEKVAFSSNIDGNTFSGNHNGIDSKGAFYGSQANQVAGIFYQTQGVEAGYHGVFGATDKRISQ